MSALPRTDTCVCGGTITADQADEDAVMDAVVEHQRTPRHMAWSAGARTRMACVGYGDRGCLVMVPAERLRCRWCQRRHERLSVGLVAA